MSSSKHHPTYYLLTLGCPKNQVDSDSMAALLDRQGYLAIDNPRRADVLIVNTCGFLAASQAESLDTLQDLSENKRRKQILIAAGCMAERNSKDILAAVPGVDGVLGTRRWMDIVRLVDRLRQGQHKRQFGKIQLLGEPADEPSSIIPRLAPQHASAYLKISDGCNAPCAFCTIPSFKGKLRSHPVEALVAEAQALVTAGARELIVVAQDTTDYGRDWGKPDSLPRLLGAIATRTTDLRWLRLMYAYPGHISDALIETMATTPHILPYLDLPLQHGHPDTLKRMRRPSNIEMVLGTIDKLRAAMPDIALRTTFIVGYPGETEAEFQGLLDFIEAIQFDKVGAFPFSPEPGTPAATLPNQVSDELKQERWERLMALQQEISLRRNKAQIGRTLEVLVEGYGDGVTLARSYRDAPEVDGYVLIPAELPLETFVEVRVSGALEYDLIAEPHAQTAASVSLQVDSLTLT